MSPPTATDIEIAAGEIPADMRGKYRMRLSSAAYEAYVLMRLRYNFVTVKDVLGVEIVRDHTLSGKHIQLERIL